MAEINLSAAWIATGNRTHPNLKLIDELRTTTTYDGHEDDIDELERSHLKARSYDFDRNLFRVREKEKMYYGDRSHPRLVRLDSIRPKLTYDGWKQDFKDAEEVHMNDCFFGFSKSCKKLERRQAIHDGDFSHKALQDLNDLRLSLSYPGWQSDFDRAMDSYKNGSDFVKQLCMREKQKMYEGDRSHPRLVSLDMCSSNFSYPGWEDDVKEAERLHLQIFDDCFELVLEGKFTSMLKNFTRKQHEHDTGSVDLSTMHPLQREIIQTKWSYPGWESDVENTRNLGRDDQFETNLQHFKLKQMIHDDDFSSHPALIKLDSMELTYPDWEEDVEDATQYLFRNGYCWFWKQTFESRIRAMENKQHLFNKDDHQECCICMTDLLSYDRESVKKLKCGHVLHAQCLNDMIQHRGSMAHSKCPLCRAPIE